MAVELIPLLRSEGRLGTWFAEGWSARAEPDCHPLAEIEAALEPGDALILGSQMNYAQTRSLIARTASRRIATIFMFDHWKNYAEHFRPGPLADLILVPDEIGRSLALAALGAEAGPRLRILPHLALEAAVDRIAALRCPVTPGMIAFLLDPTELAEGLGYDWRCALQAAGARIAALPGRHMVVKPHPRQSEALVAEALTTLQQRGIPCEIYVGDAERLIAAAEEVWGMTTVALNTALAAGKPIRSFQPGRNRAGASASNPHIEPFALTEAVAENGAIGP